MILPSQAEMHGFLAALGTTTVQKSHKLPESILVLMAFRAPINPLAN